MKLVSAANYRLCFMGKCEMDERNWKCIAQLTLTKSGFKFYGDIGYLGSTVAQW